MKKTRLKHSLLEIYNLLHKRFGPRNWWPGDTKLEIIIGAILTQNTAWHNVQKAIANLKGKKLLTLKKLYSVSIEDISKLIMPAGYFNTKSIYIRNFLQFLNTSYYGSINKMFRTETEFLRQELLNINGIGPETADSILLYAGKKPIFVVDSYTKRIFSRHRFINEKTSYKKVQELFLDNLPMDVQLYNEFHALIVELGKTFCRSKKPLCNECPIRRIKNNG